MVGDREDLRPGEDEGLVRTVEAFSRDLLGLVRAVRVYPPEHPFLQGLSERLVAMVGRALPEPLVLGVTSKELSVGGSFVGGRDSRAADLAAHFHAHRILRITWTREAGLADVLGFAELLGEPRLQGDALGKALRRRRIFAIDVEPLVLERIHDAFREAPRAAPRAGGGREAWLWLLSDEVPPEEIAEALSSDGFWEDPLADGAEGDATAAQLTEVLLRMGQRLEAALERMPAGQRRKVTDRLARAGRQVSPTQLAAILRAADATGALQGPVGDALDETFGGDKLVDLLAGMVSQEGRDTRRLAEVYGRFAHGDRDELLQAVRARLSSADKGGFTVDVWEAVEDFLLGLREDPYMGSEYSSSLEALAAAASETPAGLEEADFQAAIDDHLDQVFLGLTLDAPGHWGPALLERVRDRLDFLSIRDLLSLVAEVQRGAPGLLDTRPDLVERVFRASLGRFREFEAAERQAFLDFGRDHEEAVLEAVLRALAEEESMSVRRLLVEMVAQFSPATTPMVVSRIRSAPWYVTRNLTISLGRKGDPAAIPVLRSLLGHEHPKVRREAILALGNFEVPPALEALRAFVSAGAAREDRTLAERVLKTADPRGGKP